MARGQHCADPFCYGARIDGWGVEAVEMMVVGLLFVIAVLLFIVMLPHIRAGSGAVSKGRQPAPTPQPEGAKNTSLANIGFVVAIIFPLILALTTYADSNGQDWQLSIALLAVAVIIFGVYVRWLYRSRNARADNRNNE